MRRAARHRLVRAGGLLVAIVVCSGSWWDPRSWVSDAINGMLETWAGGLASLAEGMLLGAFDGSLGTLNTAEWTVATVFTGRLGAVMGVFAVAFCAIEVIAGMAGRDPMRILKGALIAMFAWPLTATAAWATIKLTGVSDSLSTAILADSPAKELAARFFAPLRALTATNPPGGAIVALVFALLVLLPTVLLSLVMAFRSFGLLVAVAFAPVALMTQGWAKMRGMARGWATIVGALLVTKPLAAGIIVISLELIESVPDMGALVMGVVGLWMAAFAPVAAASLFTFAGGEVAAAQGAASAQAGRHMVGTARATAAGGKKVGKQAMGLVAGGAGGAGLAAGAGGSKAGNVVSAGGGAKGAQGEPAPKSAPDQSAGAKPAPGGSSPPGSSSGSGAGSSAGSGAGKTPAQSGSAGQRSGRGAPTPAPAASTGSAPGATRAGGGPASTSGTAPQQAPAHPSAWDSGSPAVGSGRDGAGDGRGAGFVSAAGGFGATTGIGHTPAGVSAPGGASSAPTGSPGAPGGGPSMSGGTGVTTSAASGSQGSGSRSGTGSRSSSGSTSGSGGGTTGSSAPGGGVTSTGAGHASTSEPAVTGAGGVTGAVVDDVLGAVSDPVEIKGDETK